MYCNFTGESMGIIKYYNSDVRHRKLNNRTPQEVFDLAG